MSIEFPEWYKKVYAASEFPQDERLYWEHVKDYVIERDGLRCQACRKKKPRRSLTAHHIIPRSEGGNDDLDNLITLDNECHDYVEAQGYRSAQQIIRCTKRLTKKEIQDVGLDAPIPERPKPVWVILTEEPEPVICTCGIHHTIVANERMGRDKPIKCICGLIGMYRNGEWVWEPKPKLINQEKPAAPKKKSELRVANRRKVSKPKLKIGPYDIRCNHCYRRIALSSPPKVLDLVNCICGASGMYSEGGWFWF